MRADARRELVAAASRSPLAPRTASCRSRSANTFVGRTRSCLKLNIGPPPASSRRVEFSKRERHPSRAVGEGRSAEDAWERAWQLGTADLAIGPRPSGAAHL